MMFKKFKYIYRVYNKTSEVFFESQDDAIEYASGFAASIGMEIDPTVMLCNSQKDSTHDGEIEAGAAHLPESYDAPTSAPKLTCSPPMSPTGERAANKSQSQICPDCDCGFVEMETENGLISCECVTCGGTGQT